MERAGKLKKITVTGEKGTLPRCVGRARLLENQGLEGDRHCKGGERQLTLLSAEAADWRSRQETAGLCFQKFQENLQLEGVHLECLAAGDRIHMGEAVIELASVNKECFPQCARACSSAAGRLDCRLRREARYAKVLKGGVIHSGERVFVEKAEQESSSLRYLRQLSIPQIGGEGQKRLGEASALVIGAGGLGCPVITALGEAGVGRIGIADGDRIECTNLNRQFLYQPSDIGKSKAGCAARWLKGFRPDCQMEALEEAIDGENVTGILQGYDIVLTAVDHISTRMLVNQAAQKLGLPLVDGAIDGFYGTVTAVLTGEDPCLACVNPQGKEPGHAASSLGTTAMIVGALQAQAALLYLTGNFGKIPRMLSYDGLYGTLEEIPVEKNPDCGVCGSDTRWKNPKSAIRPDTYSSKPR